MAFVRIISQVLFSGFALLALLGSLFILVLFIQLIASASPIGSLLMDLSLLWHCLGWACSVFASFYILLTRWHGRFYYLVFPAAVILLIHDTTGAAEYANAGNYPARATIMGVILGSLKSLVLIGGMLLAATGFWKIKSPPTS